MLATEHRPHSGILVLSHPECSRVSWSWAHFGHRHSLTTQRLPTRRSRVVVFVVVCPIESRRRVRSIAHSSDRCFTDATATRQTRFGVTRRTNRKRCRASSHDTCGTAADGSTPPSPGAHRPGSASSSTALSARSYGLAAFTTCGSWAQSSASFGIIGLPRLRSG
jgi:hypothetical protein